MSLNYSHPVSGNDTCPHYIALTSTTWYIDYQAIALHYSSYSEAFSHATTWLAGGGVFVGASVDGSDASVTRGKLEWFNPTSFTLHVEGQFRQETEDVHSGSTISVAIVPFSFSVAPGGSHVQYNDAPEPTDGIGTISELVGWRGILTP
jgi:hypothetical protein